MNSEAHEQEITKEAFKEMYFKYATPDSGWTEDYWNTMFEAEEGKKYFFSTPEKPESNRMFIVTDTQKRSMVFLTENAEDLFFGF
jgi:hypothetical protein